MICPNVQCVHDALRVITPNPLFPYAVLGQVTQARTRAPSDVCGDVIMTSGGIGGSLYNGLKLAFTSVTIFADTNVHTCITLESL